MQHLQTSLSHYCRQKSVNLPHNAIQNITFMHDSYHCAEINFAHSIASYIDMPKISQDTLCNLLQHKENPGMEFNLNFLTHTKIQKRSLQNQGRHNQSL